MENTMFTQNFGQNQGMRQVGNAQNLQGNFQDSRQGNPGQNQKNLSMPCQNANIYQGTLQTSRNDNAPRFQHDGHSEISSAITLVLIWTFLIFAIVALAKWIFTKDKMPVVQNQPTSNVNPTV